MLIIFFPFSNSKILNLFCSELLHIGAYGNYICQLFVYFVIRTKMLKYNNKYTVLYKTTTTTPIKKLIVLFDHKWQNQILIRMKRFHLKTLAWRVLFVVFYHD